MTPSQRDALWLTVMILLLTVLSFWVLTIGSSDISLLSAWQALWSGDPAQPPSRGMLILRDVRLPRVLVALLVGAALAAAGAIMQAVTGNPMADPGILGVNAGASFAVVMAIAVGELSGTATLIWFAFGGAGAAALVVYLLGGAGQPGGSPIRLVLAGVVVASFLAALTMSVLVVDAQTFDEMRLWTAGSLKGRDLTAVLTLLPYVTVAIVSALALRRQFNVLALGAGVATSLGQSQALWRAISALLVVMLAGSAVALAGPIGFVGLVVPHLVRLSIGADYARIIPFACVLGAALTLLADALPRAVLGRDVPVGISLALIGAPFFIWLARRARWEGG